MDLDLLNLTKVLGDASGSERGLEQKMAENQLKEWEILPGYHYLLQSIYNDLSSPLQIRWLAIINFKNGIEKYWRSSRKNAISKDEKQQIKERVFEMIDEPNAQLSIQNSQAISRIARLDFPNEWEGLFDQIEQLLANAVETEHNVKIHNILLILNQVIKNLAMARIGRTRPALQSKTTKLTNLLIQIYTKFFNEWMSSNEFVYMEISYLSLKVLKKFLTDVYDDLNQVPELMAFTSLSIKHFQVLIQNYDTKSSDIIMEKYIKCFSKIYYLLTKANPTNLILLPSSKEILFTLLDILQKKAELIYSENDDDEGNDDAISLWEFLAIKTLLIFKILINFLFKKGSVLTLKSNSKVNKLEISNAIELLSKEFFSYDLIISLTELLINYYIKLRPKDLESWMIEPEEWCNEEINENFEYSIRKCSENFFQDLINNFKEQIVPFIMNKIQNEMSNYNETSISNILIKDSIFSIFQLSANSIYESIDFNYLFKTIFLPESIKNDILENKILKRRVCLLINEYLSLKVIDKENMSNIFNLLINFLDGNNPIIDKVVKLTAIQCLHNILNDWDFDKNDIKPFVLEFLTTLFTLINEMELIESKLYLFNTISDLIYKTNPLIEKQQLIEIIPKIEVYWDKFNDSSELILKNSLLRITKNLIISLNENSEVILPLTIKLIEISCSPKSSFYSILSEEGFELWLTILQYSNSNNEIFNSLFNQFFINGLLNQTEILPLILEILRSFILLNPGFFQNGGNTAIVNEIFNILSKYMVNLRDDSLEILISIFEILILQNSSDLSYLLNLLNESGILKLMIETILDDEQSSLVSANYLLIISRITFNNPEILIEFFKYLFNNDEATCNKMLNKFYSIWIIKFEINMGNPRNKKMNLLGLTSLFRVDLNILANFNTILSIWITSLEEVNELGKGDSEKYHSNYLYEFKYNEDLTIIENGEYKRFNELFNNNDPVHNISLKDYLKETFVILKQNLGGEDEFNKFLKTLDSNLVENIQYFLYEL